MNFGHVKALTESRCGASREGSNAVDGQNWQKKRMRLNVNTAFGIFVVSKACNAVLLYVRRDFPIPWGISPYLGMTCPLHVTSCPLQVIPANSGHFRPVSFPVHQITN